MSKKIYLHLFLFLSFNWYEHVIGSGWWATQRRSEMQMIIDLALIKVNNYPRPLLIWCSVDMPTFLFGLWSAAHRTVVNHTNSLHFHCTLWRDGVLCHINQWITGGHHLTINLKLASVLIKTHKLNFLSKTKKKGCCGHGGGWRSPPPPAGKSRYLIDPQV